MEQHPVPQNVTTFQFRLIGDMTLKQFGYLIAGGILAVIAYKLPLPFIVTWPLAGAFAFLGVGFAFIPVEERPMDVWVFSFFKSVYSPTQYIWSHTQEPAPVQMPTPVKQPAQPQVPPKPVAAAVAQPAPSPIVSPAPSSQKAVLSNLFQPVPQAPKPAVPSSFAVPPVPHSFLDNVSSFFHPKPHPAPASSPAPAPVPSVTGHHPVVPQQTPQQVADAQANTAMHAKMASLEATLKALEEKLSAKTVTEERVLELQKQLTEVMTQKAKTEEELIALKRHREQPPAPMPPPATTPPPSAPVPPLTPASRGAVNVITTQEGAVKAGLPRLTNVPNVVTGLVKDDTGNFLPGILVTITNSEGVPVRALKTNKLGQFAASTQLASGTYFVEIEDPRARFTFSRVQITLNGAVVPVLEIIAKSEKVLTREKLAQEIFGKTT
ncbi:MAG: hypothetical protein ACOY3M_00670 [Patescibacteria group bacterium]